MEIIPSVLRRFCRIFVFCFWWKFFFLEQIIKF